MGKKGKKGGKGRKSAKGGDSSLKGLNPREAFLTVRIKMLKKMIADSKEELRTLGNQSGQLTVVVNDEEEKKFKEIGIRIKRMYSADKHLGLTLIESIQTMKNKDDELLERREKRALTEEQKRGALHHELKINEQLCADILKWKKYRDEAKHINENNDLSIDHDSAKIIILEMKLHNHQVNTLSMKTFLKYLIQKEKKDIDLALTVLFQRHRMLAFKEAIEGAPSGALRECQESEELEKWVGVQTQFVESERAIIDGLQKKNLQLIDILDSLKCDRMVDDGVIRIPNTLEDDKFPKTKPIKLPAIPRLKLHGETPALLSAESHADLQAVNSY